MLPYTITIYVPLEQFVSFVTKLPTVVGTCSVVETTFPAVPGTEIRYHKFTKGLYTYLVYQSSHMAASFPVLHSACTLLMNVLAGDHISIPYPMLTLRRRGSIHPMRILGDFWTHGILSDVVFLQRQGFHIHYPIQTTFHTAIQATEQDTSLSLYTCPVEERSFYDSESLVLPLHSTTIQLPEYSCLWSLGGLPCGCIYCSHYDEASSGYVEGTCISSQKTVEFCPM